MRHSSWVIVVVMSLGLMLTGCKAPGLTKNEVHRRHAEAIQQNSLQFQDDVDTLFMIDRPSRLSPMMVR
jgi:hypothetical protein